MVEDKVKMGSKARTNRRMERATTGMRWIAVFGLVLGVVPGPPQAQQPEKAEVLEPVVVTASKVETPLHTVGQSVTTIRDSEMDQRRTTDALEELRNVVGLRIVQTGSRGGTTSLFTRGSDSGHTLFLVDGVRVNESGASFEVSDLNAANIERIEVIRGPQSALYGSEALGGVVHIITKKGRGPTRGSISLGGGSNDALEAKVRFSGGRGDLDYSFGLERVNYGGILPINNSYKNTTAAGQIGFAVNPDLRFRFSARNWNSRFEFPTESAGDRFQVPKGTQAVDREQYRESQKLLLALRTEADTHPWWTHVLTLSLLNSHILNDDPRNDPPDTATSKIQTLESHRTLDYFWRIRPETPKPFGLAVTLGLEERLELFDRTQVRQTQTTTTPTLIDQRRQNESVYGQAELAFGDRVFVTPGFRAEFNSEFGSFGSPKVSVAVWTPESKTKIRGSIGRGFKQPTFFQQFGGGATAPSPGLKPERSRGWDVGADQDLWSDRLRLELTYYNNRFTDQIAFIGGSTSPFKNVQASKADGVEAALSVRPVPGLEIRGGWTLTRTVVLSTGGLAGTALVEGEPFLRRPRHTGFLNLGYRWRGFNVGADATFTGRSIDRNFFVDGSGRREELPGWTKVDLAASYTLPRAGGIELVPFVRLENLLDQQYEEVLGFSTRRFHALAGLEVRF